MVPFIRPKILSRDKSSSIDVIIHAINFYKKKNINFEYVALLEPTSPLTDSRDLDRAYLKIVKIKKKKADSVVGISKKYQSPPRF